MARLRLTLHDVVCFESTIATTSTTTDLSVSTEKETAETFFQVGTNKYGYKLTLVDFNFKKKMYQPTEVTADIQISMTSGTLQVIDKSSLVTLFMNKKVSLVEMPSLGAENQDPLQTIGNDYYVQEVKPRYKKDAFYMTLKIYSVDNLLKLHHYSRTFVAKNLVTGILAGELKGVETDKKTADGKAIINYKYPLPYDQNNSIKLKYDGAKQLFYKENMEHIFPYLVQYNESFYDFLARTTNRWGEFMYYEDNKLNIGYNHTVGKEKSIGDDYTITYVDLDNESMSVPDGQKFDFAGSEEKGFLDDTQRKSPNSISGILFYPTVDKWDKVLMKEITSLLKHDKNVPTWIGNRLFQGAWDAAVKAAEVSSANTAFNDTYFPDSNKPGVEAQYGEYDFGKDDKEDKDDGFNPFSEINSTFKSDVYEGILKKEYAATKDAICIDFDTTCPKLKLGDVITVHNKNFIVVEITSQTEKGINCKVEDYVRVVKTPTQNLNFKVIALAQNGDNRFYPTVIPAGHVRYSDPQIATITDANDPSGKNRVRVMYNWEDIKYKLEEVKEEKKDEENAQDSKKKKKKPKKLGVEDESKKKSSPWLTFATSSSGSPVVGKHYEMDSVLIGYIDGNIERPYVLGGLSSKGERADCYQSTPGGHQFQMMDDEDGIKNFITSMFLPCVGTFSPFFNAIPGFSKLVADHVLAPARGYKNNIAMGGGFEISDKYGIYKVSGSTDNREISIASPWGNVNINAFTGINIEAPNGDVCITGKNIKLEAGNNIEIVSGTNIKQKIMGEGGVGGFFVDVTAAVAKKLVQKAINLVDLSLVRSALEIIFRPAEGQLRIKSNRYLMLDAGKGDCVYPQNAYVSADAWKKYMKEQSDNYSRKGLSLSTNILEMLSRVQTLGNMMDNRYIASYNKCIQKFGLFKTAIENAQTWGKDYRDPGNLHPKICKDYTDNDLVNAMWADPNNAPDFDATKMGFVDQQFSTTDADSVPQSIAIRYGGKYPVNAKPGEDVLKAEVLDVRKQQIELVVKAANEMRQAIIDFLKFTELDEKKDIKATAKAFRDRKMPDNFMEALVNAFKKANLGNDLYYFLSIDDDKRKGLKALTTELTSVVTKPHRVVLKRKASILLLEGMGFKDEWRKKKVVDAAPTTVQVMPVGVPGAVPVTVPLAPPLVPPAPPAPQLEVAREFTTDKLTDAYWPNYVNSIVMIPELKPDEWKITKELKKVGKDAYDKLTSFWDVPSENDAWSQNKNGTILFSDGAKVFSLDKEIKEIPAPPRGNLTDADSIDDDVKNLLQNIRDSLTSLN